MTKIPLKVLGQSLMDAALDDPDHVVEYENAFPTLNALRMECYRLRAKLRDEEIFKYDRLVLQLRVDKHNAAKLQIMVRR